MSQERTRVARVVAAAACAILTVSTFGSVAAAAPVSDFRSDMRKLWEDHITWTRLYIISASADLPDKDATAGRLLQNQTDLGNAIKPFYGDEAGDKLTALLKDHINGAVAVLAAAKAGDQAALQSANAAWYANADDIASFLSAANPTHWPVDTMKAEMKKHLDLTLAEASAHLKLDHAADVKAYDAVHEHILHMADTLSSGIVAQFPDRFDQASAGQFATRAAMRKLWEDHVQWTRFYIVSAAADLPSTQATAQRLLQNQTDIGNAVKPMFGEAAGNKLTALLKEHINGAVAVLAAAKSGDQAALDKANAAWYANADEIATFLSSADPTAWPPETMKAEMKQHLDLTLAEASAHLKQDHAADVQGYDAVHTHILHFADTLMAGAASHVSSAVMPSSLPKTGGGATAATEAQPEPLWWTIMALLVALLTYRRHMRRPS